MFKFKKNKQILNHIPYSPEYPDVFPARNVIPEWYKKSKGTLDDAPTPLKKTATVKRCVPFLDAMTFGYMIPLPVDINIIQINGFAYYEWRDDADGYDPIHIRPQEAMQSMPVPTGYEDTYPAWNTRSFIEIPKGYSALITHPLNHTELPFFTVSGIIDSGVLFEGNIPFFIKKGFEGLIPKGTPILQVLPFKTDNWESVKDETLRNRAHLRRRDRLITAFSWYKNNVWVKKSFD
jgi:hypothetical protein